VTTSVNARPVTRHIVVLSLARMADIAIPEEHEPWMAATDAVGFPVEWAWRVDPRHPDEVSKEMTKIGNRVDGQVEHWLVDHGKRPPKQLARQADARATVEDEQRRGFTHLSTRTRGWYRIAVSAPTEREALERAAAVVELYKPHTKWVRDLGQYALAREFVPGEPLASSAHCRHFPVVKVAAGLPAVTAEVGDRRGFHISETAGLAARAVCFDPWYLPEVMEASGVVPILGVQGSGKSALMGMLCYKATLSGARGVAMDPAGRLHRVLALPELAGISHQVDVLGGQPGSLSPYAAVPEPNTALLWADCRDAEEFRDKLGLERAAVEQTRRDLAVMTLRWSLPIELNRNPDVLTRIRAVVADAPAGPSSTLWAPIDRLRKGDELALTIAGQLVAASERELGRLFYPVRHKPAEAVHVPATFTVFNLKGLVKPDDSVELADYTPEELLYRPIMSLAAWTSLQLIYRGDPHERKFFGLDEAQEVTEVSGAGRTLVHKLRTDSRKNNNAVFLVSQHARVVLDAANFVGAVFVGRTQSEDAQTAALKLLGKPPGRGYEQLLGSLSARPRRDSGSLAYREFIYRDGLGGEGGTGGMERIRVSMAHHPDLFTALDTTPRPANRATMADRGPIPTLDDLDDLDQDPVPDELVNADGAA
jgi:hypothetical protein